MEPFATSENTAELDAALARAQGEFSAAARDRKAEIETKSGGKYTYSYADLASVIGSCRAALAKQEVSVTQSLVNGDPGRITIVTRVAHKGQWLRSVWSMPCAAQRPQEWGSAVTYGRRYALAAAVGVVTDDDDDAQVAQEATKQAKPQKQVSKAAPKQQEAKEERTITADELEAWKVEIGVRAEVSPEKVRELSAELEALPTTAKEALSPYYFEQLKRARKLQGERIKQGQPPAQEQAP